MKRVFPGVGVPSVDMQAVRDGRRSPPFYVDIPLSTARARSNGITSDTSDTSGKALVLMIAGNSFYSDPVYDLGGNPIAGNAIVHFQDVNLGAQGTPFMVTPQFVARIPFTQILVENYAQAGKYLRAIYGMDLDFQPGLTANVAPVSVIDGGKARTLAGQAFLGQVGQGKVAAQSTQLQIRMPSGATKRAIVRQIIAGSDTAGSINIRRYDTALTTLTGNAQSKLLSGSASVAELRNQTGGAVGAAIMAFEYVQALVTAPPVVLAEPIVIRPGEGLLVQSGTVNVDLQATFEFIEEDNV